MKTLIPALRTMLSRCFDTDELPVVIKALCCELLGVDEYTYYLKEEVALTAAQHEQLAQAVQRLQRGEPLQYVLGSAPFAGLTMHVDSSVLIPRPETAQLVHLACQRAPEGAFLDVGTGSGCIAIALAKEAAGRMVVACDVSDNALATARANAHASEAAVHFIHADVLSILNDGQLPDELQGIEVGCIVSNPPYIRQCERCLMEGRVLDWEPALALFVPDDDPMLFYRALARLGQTPLLRAGGQLCVEVNRVFGFETAVLFELYGYEDVRVYPDLYDHERFVVCHKKQ